MKLVLDALRFAANAHKTQKYGEFPYIHHCASVVYILQHFGVTDETVLTAGALHDVLEDTTTTHWELVKSFGDRVADIVLLVSNPHKKIQFYGHTEYYFEFEEWDNREDVINLQLLTRKQKHEIQYPKIVTSQDAILVKLADRIANVETGEKRDMYKKEYAFFRNTIYNTSRHPWLISLEEHRMWDWLDAEMKWDLTNEQQ